MKKLFIFLSIFLLTGCKVMDTPTKKVEALFNNYQSLDDSVLNQLEDVANDEITFTDEQKKEYIEIMKKHYQSLKYDIKDTIEDGNTAMVTVEIEVTDYSKILGEANEYLDNHKDEFYDEDELNNKKFNEYRIERLKKAEDTIKYTLDISLSKINDEWVVDELDKSTLDKIQGVYNYEKETS